MLNKIMLSHLKITLFFMTSVFLPLHQMYGQELQKIFIESFTYDPMDQTAKTHEKTDNNGDLYALVKVRPAADKFTFDFGYLIHEVDGHRHDGETWIYVQKNASYITIRREGFEPVMHSYLGRKVEPGCTYILKLSYEEPSVKLRKQYLQFQVSPSDCKAIVKVHRQGADAYDSWATDEKGTCSRYIECGSYDYQIAADNYETSVGNIVLDTPNKTLVEKVTLVPDFGYLQVDDAYGIKGAQIYVDDKYVGTVPYTGKERFESGSHTVTILNGELFKPYTMQFTITSGETTVLKPELMSNTSEITLLADDSVEIYIDKVLKGTSRWSGSLKEGRYEVECRKKAHEPTVKTIDVKADVPQTILLNNPKPITGIIAINTSPSDATVTLDGKEVGHTPTVMENVLIGTHAIGLSLANYKAESMTVEVKKGKTEEIHLALSSMTSMTIDSDPSDAILFLDGKQLGTTPYTAELASGDHSLRLTKKGYKTLERTVHLDASHPTESFTLKRQHVQPTGIYIQPTFQAGQMMGFGGAIGGYIANVNVEAAFLAGMSSSETIYWNNTSYMPEDEQLRPSFYGGKAGYGISIGRSMRLTPQAGAGVVSVKGDVSSAYAVNASASVRFEYMIVNHLGITVAPEYSFAVKKSDTFNQLSSLSTTVNGWASGFNFRIGIFFSL